MERQRALYVETPGAGGSGRFCRRALRVRPTLYISGRFWDAMWFYTDVLDAVVGWLYRAVADLHRRLRQHDRAAGYQLYSRTVSYIDRPIRRTHHARVMKE